MDLLHHALDILPPKDDAIAVVAVATSSGTFDLSARTELALKSGRYVTIVADDDIWFSLSDAAGSVDETAVTGNTQAFRLAAGLPYTFRYNETYKHLNHKSALATFLRVYVSSKGQTEVS